MQICLTEHLIQRYSISWFVQKWNFGNFLTVCCILWDKTCESEVCTCIAWLPIDLFVLHTRIMNCKTKQRLACLLFCLASLRYLLVPDAKSFSMVNWYSFYRSDNAIKNHWHSITKHVSSTEDIVAMDMQAFGVSAALLSCTPSQNSGLVGAQPVRLFDTPRTVSNVKKCCICSLFFWLFSFCISTVMIVCLATEIFLIKCEASGYLMVNLCGKIA